MPNKLLGVAGFTADKVAKGFSVNEHGHINIAGNIDNVVIGSAVEPYGPNYQGVVAVMGREVQAGKDLPRLTLSPRFIGSTGNRLFFQNDTNSDRITITNLNLQEVDEYTIPGPIGKDTAYKMELFVKGGHLVYHSEGHRVVVNAITLKEVFRVPSPPLQSTIIHNGMLIVAESKHADNTTPQLKFYNLSDGELEREIDIVSEIVEPITNGTIGFFSAFIAAENDKLVLAIRTGGGSQEDVVQTLNIIELNNYSVVELGLRPNGLMTVDKLSVFEEYVYFLSYSAAGKGTLRYVNLNNLNDTGIVADIYNRHSGETRPADVSIIDGIISVNSYNMEEAPNYILHKNTLTELVPGAHLYNWSAGKDPLGRIVMCTRGYAMLLSEELVLKGYRMVGI